MAIELHGECAMVIKREIGLRFSGGMEAFRQRYGSRNLQDGYLIALCADCSSGLQTIVDELTENGLVVGEHFALAGVWDGVYTACEGINFHRKPCHDGNVRWAAVSSDDPRPGKVTVCKPHPGETCFGGGSGILIPFNPNRMRSSKPPSTPPGSENDNPMLGAMNALEDAMIEAYRQNMARLGLEPYDEPPEGTEKGSHE